jgi:cytochrome P450
MLHVDRSLDIDVAGDCQTRGNAILEDLDRIRESEPVFWSDKSKCWIVTRHQDVAELLSARLPLLHGGRIEAFAFRCIDPSQWAVQIPTLARSVPLWSIDLDGPDHSRLRALLVKGFTKGIVERVRAYARDRTNRLLDHAIATREVEFNEQIARDLTGHVLFKLIGMPEELFPKLREWATAVVEGLAGVEAVDKLLRAERAAAEMNQAVLLEIEERKSRPQEDLLTSLLQATEAGDKLTMEELLAQMQVIIVAGHDTTANTMTLGVEALSRHPSAWEYWYSHPEQSQKCVAELQRYVAMSGAQALRAGKDFEWHGKQIKEGQVVVGVIAAGDRDPRKFDQPLKLDFSRDNRDSLVFAPGPHYCIGNMLAKMQLGEFFGALVSRCKSVDILDQRLAFMPALAFRGLYNLNVRFHAR